MPFVGAKERRQGRKPIHEVVWRVLYGNCRRMAKARKCRPQGLVEAMQRVPEFLEIHLLANFGSFSPVGRIYSSAIGLASSVSRQPNHPNRLRQKRTSEGLRRNPRCRLDSMLSKSRICGFSGRTRPKPGSRQPAIADESVSGGRADPESSGCKACRMLWSFAGTRLTVSGLPVASA